MKKLLLMWAMILPFVLCSCGDDKEEPTYLLFKDPCTQWGCSKSVVKNFMNSFTLLNEDENGLLYGGKYKEEYNIYTFKSNALYSAGVAINTDKVSAEDLVKFLDDNYNYVGKQDDYYFYKTLNGKNFIALSVEKMNSEIYYLLLFEPVDDSKSPIIYLDKRAYNEFNKFEICKDKNEYEKIDNCIQNVKKLK